MNLYHATKFIIVSLLFMVGFLAFSQANCASGDSLKILNQNADTYFRNQEWEKASIAYEMLVKKDPENGKAWFRLGLSYHSRSEYLMAISAFKQANKLEFNLPITRYNLACSYALLGKKQETLHWLTEAIEAGFQQIQLLHTDNDLASLRSDPRYQELTIQLDERLHPCLYNPKYQELDFWLGEWDVFNRERYKIGRNSIRKIQKNCVILENWISTKGTTGTSITYFNPATGKWKQNWVDEFGNVIWYEGEVINGTMHFKGETINKDGNIEAAKVIIEPLPDGRVHHLIEHSKDGGRSWYTWFEGYYQKHLNRIEKTQ